MPITKDRQEIPDTPPATVEKKKTSIRELLEQEPKTSEASAKAPTISPPDNGNKRPNPKLTKSNTSSGPLRKGKLLGFLGRSES